MCSDDVMKVWDAVTIVTSAASGDPATPTPEQVLFSPVDTTSQDETVDPDDARPKNSITRIIPIVDGRQIRTGLNGGMVVAVTYARGSTFARHIAPPASASAAAIALFGGKRSTGLTGLTGLVGSAAALKSKSPAMSVPADSARLHKNAELITNASDTAPAYNTAAATPLMYGCDSDLAPIAVRSGDWTVDDFVSANQTPRAEAPVMDVLTVIDRSEKNPDSIITSLLAYTGSGANIHVVSIIHFRDSSRIALESAERGTPRPNRYSTLLCGPGSFGASGSTFQWIRPTLGGAESCSEADIARAELITPISSSGLMTVTLPIVVDDDAAVWSHPIAAYVNCDSLQIVQPQPRPKNEWYRTWKRLSMMKWTELGRISDVQAVQLPYCVESGPRLAVVVIQRVNDCDHVISIFRVLTTGRPICVARILHTSDGPIWSGLVWR